MNLNENNFGDGGLPNRKVERLTKGSPQVQNHHPNVTFMENKHTSVFKYNARQVLESLSLIANIIVGYHSFLSCAVYTCLCLRGVTMLSTMLCCCTEERMQAYAKPLSFKHQKSTPHLSWRQSLSRRQNTSPQIYSYLTLYQ